MDSIIYENYLGETISLNSSTIKCDYWRLKEFSFDEQNRQIQDRGKEIKLKVACTSKAVAQNLIRILNKASSTAGGTTQKYSGKDRIYYNGFYIEVNWTGVDRVKYISDTAVKLELNFFSERNLWRTSGTWRDLGGSGTGSLTVQGLDPVRVVYELSMKNLTEDEITINVPSIRVVHSNGTLEISRSVYKDVAELVPRYEAVTTKEGWEQVGWEYLHHYEKIDSLTIPAGETVVFGEFSLRKIGDEWYVMKGQYGSLLPGEHTVTFTPTESENLAVDFKVSYSETAIFPL